MLYRRIAFGSTYTFYSFLFHISSSVSLTLSKIDKLFSFTTSIILGMQEKIFTFKDLKWPCSMDRSKYFGDKTSQECAYLPSILQTTRHQTFYSMYVQYSTKKRPRLTGDATFEIVNVFAKYARIFSCGV